jgi:uncharacterized protein YvpB
MQLMKICFVVSLSFTLNYSAFSQTASKSKVDIHVKSSPENVTWGY